MTSDLSPVTTRHHRRMWHGARKIVPLGLGAAAYGFAFGVLAAQVGFPFWGIGLMSAGVFAGSSQIVAVDRFASEGQVVGAVLAGMALNLRYIGILASLSDVLRHTPLMKRLLAVHVTSDENWALTMAERARDPSAGDDFLIGSGLTLVAIWVTSTAMGALVGAGVPDLEAYGIGFAFTAAFIAIARGMWRGRRDLVPYAVSFAGTVLLVLIGWQAAFAILGGAGMGVAVSAIPRRFSTRPGGSDPGIDSKGDGCMTQAQWALIGALALGTYAIRYVGLLAGDAIERRPALRAVLHDLPGCLVVALVASSLAGKEPFVWLAAAAALVVAAWTKHVIATMVVGTLAFAALRAF